MPEIKNVTISGGDHLFTCQFWRDETGRVVPILTHMPMSVIKATGDCVATRLGIVADWMHEGARHMDQQFEDLLGEPPKEPKP